MSFKKHKDPDAVLDYEYKWRDEWLEADDTITASTMEIQASIPSGDVSTLVENRANTFTDDSTKVWLEGGTVGETYPVVNHITTAAGREDDRTLYVTIVEK